MHPIPISPIPIERSATFAVPSHLEAEVEDMVSLFLEAPEWESRFGLAEAFLRGCAGEAWNFHVEAAARILTAVLEALGEREIRSTHQAAIYRLSIHVDHRLAAMRWFAAHEAELVAFMDRNPVWTLFMCRYLELFPVETV